MIHRHWLLYSVLVILFGPVAAAGIGAYFHDHAVQAQWEIANATSQSMWRELNAANRRALVTDTAVRVMICESALRTGAISYEGDMHGFAKGRGQFKKDTFDRLKIKAGMPYILYTNDVQQYDLLKWGLDNGHGSEWACCRRDAVCRKNFTREGK